MEADDVVDVDDGTVVVAAPHGVAANAVVDVAVVGATDVEVVDAVAVDGRVLAVVHLMFMLLLSLLL